MQPLSCCKKIIKKVHPVYVNYIGVTKFAKNTWADWIATRSIVRKTDNLNSINNLTRRKQGGRGILFSGAEQTVQRDNSRAFLTSFQLMQRDVAHYFFHSTY